MDSDNNSNRFNPCAQCGNDEISDVASFCIKCGQTLFNTCTNEDCQHINSSSAFFCEKCGSYTNKLIIESAVTDISPDEVAIRLKSFHQI